ncbi:MAG: hypothetical protein ABJ246_09425 [Paracoccaceae bacterium]
MADEDFLEQLLSDAAFREGGAAGLAAASIDERPARQFFDNLRQAALSSIDCSGELGESPTVFVLSESSRQHAKGISDTAVRLTDIDLIQQTNWQGKLVFTGRHATAGWAIALPNGSTDEAIDLLEANGLGQLPVAIVYPQLRKLSCYEEGGATDDAPIRLDLPQTRRNVSLAEIFEVLEDVRRNCLLTPQIGPPGFWGNGGQYQPGPEAERTVQWIVQAQLRSNFRPHLVDVEQTIPEGRIDVLMTNREPSPELPLYPAVLELKVLKSKTQNGNPIANYKNERAVLKGLRQTKAYREAISARYSILGCFDMRQQKNDILATNLCVMAVERYFTDDRIAARVFPIYGSTDDAQEEIAG